MPPGNEIPLKAREQFTVFPCASVSPGLAAPFASTHASLLCVISRKTLRPSQEPSDPLRSHPRIVRLLLIPERKYPLCHFLSPRWCSFCSSLLYDQRGIDLPSSFRIPNPVKSPEANTSTKIMPRLHFDGGFRLNGLLETRG
jgi:hypothetical protein